MQARAILPRGSARVICREAFVIHALLRRSLRVSPWFLAVQAQARQGCLCCRIGP